MLREMEPRRDDESRRAIEEAEEILRGKRRMPEKRVEATAQALEWMKSEEQCLVALLEEHYGDATYTMQSMKIFGAQGQDDDDTFVLAGTLRGGALACEVPTTDVFVRFGIGFQRLDAKSTTFNPQIVIDEAGQPENGKDKAEQAPQSAKKTWRSWYYTACLYFDTAVLFVTMTMVFGGVIALTVHLAWSYLVFALLVMIDFVRSLPRLWISLARVGSDGE